MPRSSFIESGFELIQVSMPLKSGAATFMVVGCWALMDPAVECMIAMQAIKDGRVRMESSS